MALPPLTMDEGAAKAMMEQAQQSLGSWDYGFNTYRYNETYKLTWKTTQTEEHDMTKTSRNLYIFVVVSKDDAINIEYLVAESDQQARDEIVRERLPEGAKVKDFEIKLLRTEALKPRTEKE